MPKGQEEVCNKNARYLNGFDVQSANRKFGVCQKSPFCVWPHDFTNQDFICAAFQNFHQLKFYA